MKVIIFVSIISFAFCKAQSNKDNGVIESDVLIENDPKENYFRYIRGYNGDDVSYLPSENIPRPGGFKIYYPNLLKRQRRETEDEQELKLPEEELGEPLELEELDAENTTENAFDEPKNELVINDFIRFKRDAEDVTEKSENQEVSEDIDNVRPKREHERNGKMLLSDTQPEGNREPRGATKDQWIKQPYPVQTTNPNRNYDDSIAAATETARAPRVHFVTQRRSESAPPLVYHSYDRESRSRDINRQSSRDLDMENPYYPRPPRHYNQQTQNYPYRPDTYYRDRRQDYDYPDRYYEEDRPSNFNKQRRIIYYATLPEVVRSPPNVDLRDRYNHRDRYDNRYVTSPPVSVGGSSSGENYKYRNAANPYTKSRYDEASKTAYPLKVSADVNVREIKKNPERRIYSEADRRYPYKPNYQDDERNYDRNFQ